jgi:hypothetical protein
MRAAAGVEADITKPESFEHTDHAHGRNCMLTLRRTAASVAAAPLLALSLVAGGCGGDNKPGGGGQKLVSGNYVGMVFPDFYVAVVAPPSGEGSNERPVRVYLCSGRRVRNVNEWFSQGSAVGNTFRLSSDGGARVTGSLTAARATGTITLPGGRSLRFNVRRAIGVAGLYRVRIFPDGRVIGASESGSRVSGRVTRRLRDDRFYQLTGRFAAADGATATLTSGAPRLPTTPIQTRWVVQANGDAQGGRVKTTGTQTDFAIRWPAS